MVSAPHGNRAAPEDADAVPRCNPRPLPFEGSALAISVGAARGKAAQAPRRFQAKGEAISRLESVALRRKRTFPGGAPGERSTPWLPSERTDPPARIVQPDQIDRALEG